MFLRTLERGKVSFWLRYLCTDTLDFPSSFFSFFSSLSIPVFVLAIT